MEVIIGKNAGFCYGVQIAVDGAKEELRNRPENDKIYVLGEIVHNKQVVNELQDKGLIVAEDIEKVNNKILFRAHGVAREVYEKAKENCLEVKDFTCKKVLKIHDIAREYANNSYFIILVGAKNHPENIGTISYCGKNSYILENKENIPEVIQIIEKENRKVLLIAQTTYSVNKFEEISKEIKQKLESLNIELKVNNTICAATAIRQKETEEISKITDCMIIIGGKNSSNTKKLYNISKENVETYLIETVNELEKEDFINFNKVGIMAGTSTPNNSIIEVRKFLESIE